MSNTGISWIIGVIVLSVIFVWLLNWWYLRGASDQAYVRTGLGGRKVVLDGGMVVLPIVHQVRAVQLGMARVSLAPKGGAGLITRDRMRVDVDAEIFLKVEASEQGVSRAASALGQMINNPDDLASFFESAFLGALRATAAENTLTDLHEDRAGFVTAVEARIAPMLKKNGLELDSVAIRNLDQTALEHFNPANRFDAEGLTQLIETIEERRQMRNAIEQKSAVSIRETNLSAEKEILAVERESQFAKLQQEFEIENKRAAQSSEIARERANRSAEAEATKIETRQATSQREIAAHEQVERARLTSERALDESRILREQELRRLEIDREKFIDLFKLEKGIAVLAKSVEEAAARVQAEKPLVAAAKADEAVATMRELGAAERAAAVATVDVIRETSAEKLHAAVQMEAERLRNEAENMLTDDARAGRLKAQLIAKLESVIAETVKPISNIDGIKIFQMSGGGTDTARTPTDEVIDSALRYRVQAPMIDELMKEIGVEGANVSKMGDVFRAAKDAQSLAREVKKDGDND